jgi:hypothetical protein
MAKLRKIPSIEQGLYEAFGILKDAGIEEAIKNYTGKKKGASFYRQCADPGAEGHNIDHADSLAIDYECLKTKGIAPILRAHEALVTQFLEQNKPGQQRNLFDAINDFNKIIGDLLATLHYARSPESPGGVELTTKEKMKVKKAIVNLEKILLTLQIAVGED